MVNAQFVVVDGRGCAGTAFLCRKRDIAVAVQVAAGCRERGLRAGALAARYLLHRSKDGIVGGACRNLLARAHESRWGRLVEIGFVVGSRPSHKHLPVSTCCGSISARQYQRLAFRNARCSERTHAVHPSDSIDIQWVDGEGVGGGGTFIVCPFCHSRRDGGGARCQCRYQTALVHGGNVRFA